MMATDNLESTRLSDIDVDEICQEIVSNRDLYFADQIDDLSLMENILNDDLVQPIGMDLLTSNLNNDRSFENKLNLNLNLAEKNKIIHEQEYKLNKQNNLIEGLLGQIHMYKLQERKANTEKFQAEDLIKKLKKENKCLQSKCKIYKAAGLKLNENKPIKCGEKPLQDKNELYNHQNRRRQPKFANVCYYFKENGHCRREDSCKFQHPAENVKSNDPFLYRPPHHPARRKWKPQKAPSELWRQRGLSEVSSRRQHSPPYASLHPRSAPPPPPPSQHRQGRRSVHKLYSRTGGQHPPLVRSQ